MQQAIESADERTNARPAPSEAPPDQSIGDQLSMQLAIDALNTYSLSLTSSTSSKYRETIDVDEPDDSEKSHPADILLIDIGCADTQATSRQFGDKNESAIVAGMQALALN